MYFREYSRFLSCAKPLNTEIKLLVVESHKDGLQTPLKNSLGDASAFQLSTER